MKELYYGRIPLGVPVQKKPPKKYASHPYPVLVDGDAYKINIKPLDFTLLEVPIYKGAFDIKLTPLDFTLRSRLSAYHVNSNVLYFDVKALDFELISAISKYPIDVYKSDYITINIKPLDFTLKSLLIIYKHPENSGVLINIKPLDFTLKTG